MIPIALNLVVPLAAKWVEEQQAYILEKGEPLNNQQAFDAHLAGVKDLAKVRVLKIDFIPTPQDPILKKANDLIGLVSPITAGITFGFGIYLRADFWNDRALLVHELVHVGQYERYGGAAEFLRDYLDECLTIGYPYGPLEQEAVVRCREICGGS